MTERSARLHRHAGDAPDMETVRYDVRCLREGPVGRLGITEFGVHRDVVRQFIPHRHRARPHRIFGMQHERQFLVLDFNRFGRIHRLRLGLGDHHGDRFADMARLVGGKKNVRPLKYGAAARAG